MEKVWNAIAEDVVGMAVAVAGFLDHVNDLVSSLVGQGLPQTRHHAAEDGRSERRAVGMGDLSRAVDHGGADAKCGGGACRF